MGGLSRALQLAKVDVASLIVIEVEPDCRRLHRRRWPGCHCLGDINKVSKKQMMDLVRKVPGVTGIIGGGGSPCQGLSRLSSEREHLSDPRSALFYDLKDRLKWIQEIGVELDIWTIRFCENVIGDVEDVEEMTSNLEMEPVEVCASCISRVRRPRLYWSSTGLDDHPSFQREAGLVCDRVILEGKLEPLEMICAKGWGVASCRAGRLCQAADFYTSYPKTKTTTESSRDKSM